MHHGYTAGDFLSNEPVDSKSPGFERRESRRSFLPCRRYLSKLLADLQVQCDQPVIEPGDAEKLFDGMAVRGGSLLTAVPFPPRAPSNLRSLWTQHLA